MVDPKAEEVQVGVDAAVEAAAQVAAMVDTAEELLNVRLISHNQ